MNQPKLATPTLTAAVERYRARSKECVVCEVNPLFDLKEIDWELCRPCGRELDVM